MKQRVTKILAVDDDLAFLKSLPGLLGFDFEIMTASSAAAAEDRLGYPEAPDLLLLDLHLGAEPSLTYLEKWHARFPALPIVMLSAESDVRVAMQCLRQGAADYILKGSSREDVRFIVNRVLEKRRLQKKMERLQPLYAPTALTFRGESPAVKEVLAKALRLKGHTHLNILILGESGTGKEVLARSLHSQEGDPERPFIVANMPAIPATLMESELFGVEKGAFTDAKVSRAGKFEMADGGDIFLDEIGDLPMEMQAKILRALQEKQFQRVGETRSRSSQFRAIAATNQPLAELMANGRFREDLVYRLSDIVLWLPPLRERKDDIPELAQHFLEKHRRTAETPTLSQRALTQLQAYDWPGNIRQLESTIKRALVFATDSTIDEVDLIDPYRLVPHITTNGAFSDEMKTAERRLLADALQKSGGDRQRASISLKLPRATFYRKLSEHGL